MNKLFIFLLAGLTFYSCKSTKQDEPIEGIVMEGEYGDDYEGEYEEEYYDEYEEGYEEENPYVRPIYNSSRTLFADLIHTKLEVSFDWEKSRLKGKATITAKQHFYPSDSIVLDAKGMDILSVKMDGKDLKYNYIDSLQIHINLGRVYTKNEKFTLVIDYVSKPNERETGGSDAITSDKGLYFINPKGEDKTKMPQIWTQGETEANSVWFPTIDAPNAKTTQEMLITVEDKYITLSNGKMIASKKNTDGTRTDHWKQDLPHAPYLFMMAVGEFKVVKDTYTRPDGSKMEVNYYVEPEYENQAKAIFGETPNMIKFFSQRLGVEFPWDKYHQIVVRDYVSGAMENTGAVIFGDFVYKNERELLDGNDQSTIAHELFHHWFGDLVTCESWANLPLNESFANYSQYLWDEYRYGLDEADYQAESEADGYYSSAENGGYMKLIRYDYFDKEDMFDGHSYNKGGRILHMLRHYLGDDAFFAGLNNYLTTNKYKAAEVHHLRLAFEEVCGEDLNWFFDQWFLGKGHPIIFTEQEINKENGTVTLKIRQRQNKDEFPTYRIPVNVGIWDESGMRTEKIVIDSVDQSFTFAVKGELKNMLFDNEQMLLGKYYEEKPMSQFVHQFENATRYRARYTALKRLKSDKSLEADKVFLSALSDKFWNIRIAAIEFGTKIKRSNNDAITAKMKDLAANDPKSQVRAAALDYLSTLLEKQEATAILKKAIETDKSFLVLGKSLESLAKMNQEEALNVARKLEKENIESTRMTIAELYAQFGEEQDGAYLESLVQRKDLKGYEELRAMFSYVVWVIRMSPETLEKSQGILSQLSESKNNYTKMYFSRAVQYMMGNIYERINNLDVEIATLEEAKSFSMADEKKREKHKLEDINNNLSTFLSVEEDR